MSTENVERDALKSVIDGEVYCTVVLRPEHDQSCHGGDCGRYGCPIPVQDYGDTGELADAILASDWLADLIRRERAAAWDECAKESHALGWLHDWALSDLLARNPYRADNLDGGEEVSGRECEVLPNGWCPEHSWRHKNATPPASTDGGPR